MQTLLLNLINSPKDLRKLSREQLPQLAKELRNFIIDIVATKEGHLGASLGVVELTIALHYYYHTPEDLLVWDVGHQGYGHKILTGRRANFHTNRKLSGISGFPKRDESEYDTFGVGHSSTSISAALGMAIASQLQGKLKRNHIAVIGDASIASGMAFEGLNHAGVTKANLLVILNDNAIGIDPSVGALKEYLLKSSVGKKLHQDNIFESLNFHYSGPIDGHDFEALFKAFANLEQVEGPKFLHVVTKKGKGLKQAEKDQVTYHAPGKFDKLTGELLKKEKSVYTKFQDVFGLTLLELAQKNDKIIGITPAMPTGSSLKYMMQAIPERAFDVGIAEQHAVTFSAGMATQGFTVFCTIYSTFLQRAYDQLIHDVALQNLPVIFCVDRAGLVGEDGSTHHGTFDIAYLRCIPNMIIACPSNEVDLRNLLYTASLGIDKPIAIRYPRGYGRIKSWQIPFEKVELGKSKYIVRGSTIAILAVGNCVEDAKNAILELEIKGKISIVDVGFVKPLDVVLMKEVIKEHTKIITLEDGCIKGGFADEFNTFALQHLYEGNIKNLGVPDEFVSHGSIEELKELVGISKEKIKIILKELL
ncbi:1-deoxy-D-xylulose-5-phosphate synthase [Mesonia sp. K7]|uniref:1-deoxy-D-xylulose-5-phosphate synthase n=1 Tax=Mesonia sp. K7 TaxID=2218606 RepID=UPI000DAA0C2E|nr:1-deoxy-D-xylulose-5-phosphate synthase [Mesonia sp. K7]PZD78521.1 1-deoxy-D-xylulose-5-phosphate synthase [Mesonia sp. K7]